MVPEASGLQVGNWASLEQEVKHVTSRKLEGVLGITATGYCGVSRRPPFSWVRLSVSGARGVPDILFDRQIPLAGRRNAPESRVHLPTETVRMANPVLFDHL